MQCYPKPLSKVRSSRFGQVFVGVVFACLCFSFKLQAQQLGEPSAQQFLFIAKVKLRGFEAVDGVNLDRGDLQQWIKGYLAAEARAKRIATRSQNEFELSLEQCHLMTDALTLFLRKQGLQFHQAYIAPQNFNHKTLEITVLSGKLGKINVIGRAGLSAKDIQLQLQHLQGRSIVRRQTETALLLLNEYPAFDSFGFYSRGSEPGATNLNLKLLPAKRVQGLMLLDNYGSENTGEYRFINRIDLHRPFSSSDSLQLGILQAFEPDNSRYGWFSYRNLLTPRLELGLSAANNQFDLGSQLNVLDIEGDVLSYGLSLRYKLSRSRYARHDLSLRFNQQRFEQSSDLLADETLLQQEHLTSELAYSWQRRSLNLAQGFNLALMNVDWQEGNLNQVEPQKLNAIYQAQGDFGRNSWLHSRLAFSISGQYSEEPLPALLRQANTASSGFRALEPGLYASDRRALMRLDYRYHGLPAVASIKFVPYVFSDVIYAQQLYYDQDQQLHSSTLSGSDYGVGFELQLGKSAKLNLSYGLGADLELRQQGATDALDHLDNNHLLVQFNWNWGL